MKKILLGGVLLVIVPVVAGICLLGTEGVGEVAHVLGMLPPLRLKLSAYLQIISAIQSGQLKTKSSVVTLPSSHAGLTPKDEVLCEHRKDGRLWVLFPTWYGKGADLQGYLYSSKPIIPQDFVDAGEVKAFGLDYWSIQKVNDNWYRVMRRMG